MPRYPNLKVINPFQIAVVDDRLSVNKHEGVSAKQADAPSRKSRCGHESPCILSDLNRNEVTLDHVPGALLVVIDSNLQPIDQTLDVVDLCRMVACTSISLRNFEPNHLSPKVLHPMPLRPGASGDTKQA